MKEEGKLSKIHLQIFPLTSLKNKTFELQGASVGNKFLKNCSRKKRFFLTPSEISHIKGKKEREVAEIIFIPTTALAFRRKKSLHRSLPIFIFSPLPVKKAERRNPFRTHLFLFGNWESVSAESLPRRRRGGNFFRPLASSPISDG